MAINHSLSGEAVNVLPLGEKLPVEKTVALFKSEDLEVIRLVLGGRRDAAFHGEVGQEGLR